MKRTNCLIMGAAGRDFHDFLTFFASRPEYRLKGFTAEQIPFIDQRSFPHELAPEGYDEDIPITSEDELERLVAEHEIDLVFLSYSDLAHVDVMHRASRVLATGASFCLLGPKHTQITSRCPVIAVTAVRTGCGKSSISQLLAVHLSQKGVRCGVVRHPMPYGDLRAQRVQRFASAEDLDRHRCTVEEREEYEPYVELGLTIYAGVDYRAILEEAEKESDVILWDGGNNDLPFYAPGLSIVVADSLRPGHEVSFHPGEANFRSADIVVINKVDQASSAAVEQVREHARELVGDARILEGRLEVGLQDEVPITGKRVVVVEDGPTITHGGMPSGAGLVAAVRAGAVVIDPRPFALGSHADAYAKYTHVGPVLPALGYSEEQLRELRDTILAAKPDVVVDASPAKLSRVLEELPMPVARVRYGFVQTEGEPLTSIVDTYLDAALE